MKKFGPGVIISVLCLALGLTAAIGAPSCATIKPVVDTLNNPDGAVGAIVADCAKPEIADQVANMLAGINAIAFDPSKAQQVKNDEIDSLKKAGVEALMCAIRAGVADLTVMITGAAQHHASVDPRVVRARTLLAANAFSHGYAYVDGWDAGAYLGGSSGAGGAGGGAGGAGGGAGGAGK